MPKSYVSIDSNTAEVTETNIYRIEKKTLRDEKQQWQDLKTKCNAEIDRINAILDTL